MLAFAVGSAAQDIASVFGGAFLVLGALIWLGALLTSQEKAPARELAEGCLLIGTLCLAAFLIIENVSLIFVLVALGAACVLLVICIVRAARIAIEWRAGSVSPERLENANPVSPKITDTTAKNEYSQNRHSDQSGEKTAVDDGERPIADTVETTEVAEPESDHQPMINSTDRDTRVLVLLVASVVGVAMAGSRVLCRKR